MDTLQSDVRNEYSLGFLKNDDFKAEIIAYIQANFAQLLDQEDLELLERGDDDALGLLSEKIQMSYNRSKET